MKVKDLLKPFIKLSMYLLRIFPISQKKVVFCAYSGRIYGDNPKYIAEELSKTAKDLDCVFVLRQPELVDLPYGIRKVKYNTFSYLYEMATAKVWVDNTRKQPQIVKRKGQLYIQTWHGGLPLKKLKKMQLILSIVSISRPLSMTQNK